MKIDLISEENSEYMVVTKAKLDKQSISAIYLLGVLHNPNTFLMRALDLFS